MQAIVLSRRDFRENDQIVSFYTKEKGKIELLARGVKKITSKNAAHLEPFSLVWIEMVSGKELNHLTKVVPVNFFTNIRQNFLGSRRAGFVVSFLDKMLEVGEPDKKIWDISLSYLKFIDQNLNNQSNSINLLTLVDAYIVKLLNYLGLSPILDRCVVCEKSFQEIAKEQIVTNKKAGMYFAGGGLICPTCLPEKQKIGEEISICGLKEIGDMEILSKGEWLAINKFEMTSTERPRLHKLIYDYLTFHSEKKIVDWNKVLQI